MMLLRFKKMKEVVLNFSDDYEEVVIKQKRGRVTVHAPKRMAPVGVTSDHKPSGGQTTLVYNRHGTLVGIGGGGPC